MKYGLNQTVAPTAEPVTLAEIKSHLRIRGDSDNAIIGGYISAAREYVEIKTQRQAMSATYAMYLDRFPGRDVDESAPPGWRYGTIRIPRSPLASVTSITYVDTDGTTQTLSASLYQVATRSSPGRIRPARFQVWPIADPYTMEAVVITFVAGYASAALVPERMKQAIRMLTGHLYENREATIEVALSRIPYGLSAFIGSIAVAEYV